VLFVGAAAFFAGSEAAIVSVSRISARTFAEKGVPGGTRLQKILEDRNRTLTTILIANTFVLLATSGFATYLFVELGIPQAPLWSTLITTIVLLIFGEILPKTLAVSNSARAALRLAAPLMFFIWLLTPLTSLLLATTNLIVRLFGGSQPHGPYVTEDDIKTLVNVGVEQNVLEEGERELIHSIIEFGDTIVREVMVPRTDMVDIVDSATVREALDLSVQSGRSRLPVLGEGIDDVVGIVNLRHLADLVANGSGHEILRDHMGQAHFVPETKRVAALLTEFRSAKSHLFVVVDEYGGTAGVVTLEDVIEELVGEITDESDPVEEEDDVEQTIERGLELSGRLNIDDANVEYGLALPKDGWDTIGGLVMDLAGGVPDVGAVFSTKHYRLTVLRLDGRRVEEVLVQPLVEVE
jgi:putative hemolysin